MPGKNYIIRSDYSGTRITPDYEANFMDSATGLVGGGVALVILLTIGLPFVIGYFVLKTLFTAPKRFFLILTVIVLLWVGNGVLVGTINMNRFNAIANDLMQYAGWAPRASGVNAAPRAPVVDASAIPAPVSAIPAPVSNVPEQAAPIVKSDIKHVSAESLNMRAGPGADQPIVTNLKKDAEVTLLGETQTASDGGRWAKVRTGQLEGWVNQKYLK